MKQRRYVPLSKADKEELFNSRYRNVFAIFITLLSNMFYYLHTDNAGGTFLIAGIIASTGIAGTFTILLIMETKYPYRG